jgi:hypothetical protein
MRVAIIAAIVSTACSDGPVPASDSAPRPDHVEIVQVVTPAAVSSTQLTIPIAPTHGGDLLAVTVTLTGSAPRVRSLVTSKGAHFSRDDAMWDLGCDHTFEQWSFPAVDADVTSIELTLEAEASVLAYVIEASGLSPFPITTGQNSFVPAGTMPVPMYTDAVVSAANGDLIVAQFTACGTLTGLDPASPFTPLPAHDNAMAAYLVPTATDSYAAHWLFDATVWGQWTLVYH